jgi:hypothetical protein
VHLLLCDQRTFAQDAAQAFPWWDAKGEKALKCASTKSTAAQPFWCALVRHDAPANDTAEEAKKDQSDVPLLEYQAFVAFVTALLTLICCYFNSPAQVQLPAEPPAAAVTTPTSKGERRGTALSPTRRSSAEDRQGTAAADEEPLLDAVQAAAAVPVQAADPPLPAPAEAAFEEGNGVHPPEHAGVLQHDEAHADDPDASAAGPLDARPAELQLPWDDEAGLDDSASHGPNAAAAEVDSMAAADGSPQLGSILGPAAALNTGLFVGIIADCAVATSTPPILDAAAASIAAAVELEQAGSMSPGSAALQLEERETHNSSSSSAEIDDSETVGPPVLPRTSSASRSLAVDVQQGADSSGDVAAAELLTLPGSSFALTASLLDPSAAGVATAGTAQQRTVLEGDDSVPHTTATPTSPTVATAASTAEEGADAESTASNNSMAVCFGKSSDDGSDTQEQEQKLELSTTDGDVLAPLSPLSTDSAASPAATDAVVDVADAHLHYIEPKWTSEEVRAFYDAKDPHLYSNSLQIFGADMTHSHPKTCVFKTYAVRLVSELMNVLEDLDIVNGGALPLQHVELHPALASATAAPAVEAQAAAAPEEGGRKFPEERLPFIPESDVASDVDSDAEGDTPHPLLGDDSYGDAPSDASTAASASAATATTGRSAVASGASTSHAQHMVASDLGNGVSSDVAQDLLAEHSSDTAAPPGPTGTTATAASPAAETAAPLVQRPAAQDEEAAVNGSADVAADVASQARLAELKEQYMAAVNQGITTAELRELEALPDCIKAAWERTLPFGAGQLLWAVPGKPHELDADIAKRTLELKRAHKHLREITLTAAEAHWEAVVARVTAALSGVGYQASLAAVVQTLQFVQCAAITALRLEGSKATEMQQDRYRTYVITSTRQLLQPLLALVVHDS